MGRILIDGEPGNDFVAALPRAGRDRHRKPGKGSFYATPLAEELSSRGITHLLVTGVTTEVCVQTTMREANDRGYECLLVEDATESYFPEFKQSTLEMVRAQAGIVGWTAGKTLYWRRCGRPERIKSPFWRRRAEPGVSRETTCGLATDSDESMVETLAPPGRLATISGSFPYDPIRRFRGNTPCRPSQKRFASGS